MRRLSIPPIFGALACGGVIAFLAGLAAVSIVDAKLIASPARSPPRAAPPGVGKSVLPAPDPGEIAARSIFCSGCEGLPPPPLARTGAAPLAADLIATVVSPVSARSSLAALRSRADGRVRLVRAGTPIWGVVIDAVQERRVRYRRGGRFGYLQLGGSARSAPNPPSGTDGQIVRLGRGRFRIDRRFLRRILADPMRWLRADAVVPDTQVGRPALRIARLRPGSVLGRLGLRAGDVITELDGIPVGDLDRLLDRYANLGSARKLSIALRRGERPVRLRYAVREP